MIYDDRDVPMSWHEVDMFTTDFINNGTVLVKSYSNGRTRKRELTAKSSGNETADYSLNKMSFPIPKDTPLNIADIERALLQTEYFRGGERQIYDEIAGRGQKVE